MNKDTETHPAHAGTNYYLLSFCTGYFIYLEHWPDSYGRVIANILSGDSA